MRFSALLALLLAMCTPSFAQSDAVPSSSSMPTLQRFSIDQVDKTLDPCSDFFQYACRKWIKANPIPVDQGGWGTFNMLAIWNIAAVHNTLDEAAQTSANRTPVQQKVGDYFASCMDEAAINKAGLNPLQPELDRIAGLKKKSQIPEVIASIHPMIRPANLNFIDAAYQGVLFGIYSAPGFDNARVNLASLDQSGMALPGREFYRNDDAKSKEIRGQYVQHVARMLELSGESKPQAEKDSQSVMAIETELAKSAMDIVVRRDPKNLNNQMSLKQIQSLTPSFNWKQYFAAMQAPPSPQYTVTAPDFFRGMERLLQSRSLEEWQAYLRWSVLHSLASSLSQPFVEENFDFFGRTLGGTKELQPRWRRCSIYADIDLGEAVGQAYVAKYFPPENKQRMLEMVKAIETALGQDIDAATWMSDSTKKAAHVKLFAQIDKIGYPDHWRDYSSIEIKRDDFLGNVQRSSGFEIRRRMAKFGQPANRSEWDMTPPTVNAYEDPQHNTINFPAGILQPPFFDASASEGNNFGGIGGVIGHEIIHGYDDQGRKFDAEGNLKDWWTAADAANYDQRDRCITDEYTQDVPEAGVKQNGKLSAGEDTADNGGLHIALAGLENTLKAQGRNLESQSSNGITELQNFFLSWANVWCGELRPEVARTAVMTQGHSLERYRVNNVVGNMPEFAHAFGCRAGQPMVHANACKVW
jgi:putative endopeptidase